MQIKKTRIAITIDGGGIRGVFPLMLLNHINCLLLKQGFNKKVSDLVDFVSGTSAGAIISAGMVIRKNGMQLFSIDDLLDLYVSRGPQLFNLTNPGKAQSEGLRLLLKRKLKDIYLSDLTSEFALVSFDIKTNTPFIFEKSNTNLLLTELSTVLAACSAIPGYFAPVNFKDHILIDGIAAAKNPSMIGWEYIQKLFPDDEILFLSLGTGELTGEYFDTMEEEVNHVHQSMLTAADKNPKLHYYRLQPTICFADPRMDNASPENIHALMQDATTFIEKEQDTFQKIIELML
ncbi:MAG: patatin-like phospholipase family protein [Brumimicrobium sp.]|nr:patatin-like phospholipase family protein [Brumimicrobium sp.]